MPVLDITKIKDVAPDIIDALSEISLLNELLEGLLTVARMLSDDEVIPLEDVYKEVLLLISTTRERLAARKLYIN